MKLFITLFFVLLSLTVSEEAQFGFPDGPEVAKVSQITKLLQEDKYNAEILISFGTSTGGSAGHLALSVRDQNSGDEMVHSANFYADRDEKHNDGKHYTDDLIVVVPKNEYLFGVQSSLSDNASFGLDYGEVFKRTVIGVRIYGLTQEQLDGITSFYQWLNRDYRADKQKTDYYDDRIIYNYMNLNCAKTVAMALKFGASFKNIKIKRPGFFSSFLTLARAKTAHTPTETTLNIIENITAAGCELDVVMYKKYEQSEFIDHDTHKPFKELPNKFPSILSLDYLQGATKYDDADNLYIMHLLYFLGKYSFVINPATRELELEKTASPHPYEEAVRLAKEQAQIKSKNVVRRIIRALGIKITSASDHSNLYDY